jgi:hypothetical protein
LIPFTFVRARPIAVVALILWLAIRVPGQVQGRVHGLIQDAGGSPVAGAQVVAHSPRENTDRAFVRGVPTLRRHTTGRKSVTYTL